jgi:hypothetical protein
VAIPPIAMIAPITKLAAVKVPVNFLSQPVT